MGTLMSVVWGCVAAAVGFGFGWWAGFRDKKGVDQTVTATFTLTEFDMWRTRRTRRNTRSHTTLTKLWASYRDYRDYCEEFDVKPMKAAAFVAKCKSELTVSEANRAVGVQLIR